MKVGVLEPHATALGGRHRTMLTFADYFASRHEVTVYTNPPQNGMTRELWVQMPIRTLKPKNFCWGPIAHRYGGQQALPEGLQGQDVLLVPYAGYTALKDRLPNTRVIAWAIHPDQVPHGDSCQFWTNSCTVRSWLCTRKYWEPFASKIRVVIPPHDYSMFREAARANSHRETDVIVVGTLLHTKRLLEAAEIASRMGLSCVVIGKLWGIRRGEGRGILKELEALRGCKVIVDATTARVAREMGNAKVHLIASDTESCPLTVYEAMNAGCQVVSRRAGAVAEQLGPALLQPWSIYRDLAEAPACLQKALRSPLDIEASIRRGKEFDREAVGKAALDALESE